MGVRVSGYHGCYLRIDLTIGTSARIDLEEDRLRRFIGGSGLGVDILLGEGAAEAEPVAVTFVIAPSR